MIAYPDTGFLCSAYRTQEHSPMADAYRARMSEPLHFSSLLEFEFIQAIRLQVWLHANDRRKGYSESEADQMIADWESDVARGINVIVPVDLDAVLRLARKFSLKFTDSGGHRSLDALHVATAVHFGAGMFLTFDSRQRALAKHAGLKVPL